jgi:hypothetical protein
MKLTPPQRTALRTIAVGGVVHYQPTYGGRGSVQVPKGRPEIGTTVLRRLIHANLCDAHRVSNEGRPLRGTYQEIKITPRGNDVLAGKLRPMVKAVTVVSIEGGPSWPVTTEIDPYQWDMWHGDENRRLAYLKSLSYDVIARHVRAETTVDGGA